MSLLLIVAAAGVAWCVLSVPVALAVGRAFRAGERSETDLRFEEIVRHYDAAGV